MSDTYATTKPPVFTKITKATLFFNQTVTLLGVLANLKLIQRPRFEAMASSCHFEVLSCSNPASEEKCTYVHTHLTVVDKIPRPTADNLRTNAAAYLSAQARSQHISRVVQVLGLAHATQRSSRTLQVNLDGEQAPFCAVTSANHFGVVSKCWQEST